jgi:hypothetical protein
VIASAHFAAGVVIGVAGARFLRWRVGRIVVAFALGVILHLQMDAIPHADYHGVVGRPLMAIVALESMSIMAIAFRILRDRLTPGWAGSVAAGVIGSALPDVKFIAPLILPAELAQRATAIGERLHHAIHAGPTSFGVGMTTQLAATLLFLALLYAFPRTRAG